MFRIETAHVAALLATTVAMLCRQLLDAAPKFQLLLGQHADAIITDSGPWVARDLDDPWLVIAQAAFLAQLCLDFDSRRLGPSAARFRRGDAVGRQAAQRGAQLQPALTYAEQHPDQFAGGYMRRSCSP